MREDLMGKLAKFGLTVNQAKVYLSIVQYRKVQVRQISKDTQLHRQDVYKLLPKLEKLGLISKSIAKPFVVEALSIEEALGNLISIQREKFHEKISMLENSLDEIVRALEKQPQLMDETQFVVLTTDNALKNRANLTFKNSKKHVAVMVEFETIRKPGLGYKAFFQMIVNNRAKTRLIVASTDDENAVKQTICKIMPNVGSFAARLWNEQAYKNYLIVDNKEVWIATQQRTDGGYPSILWTNDLNIVDIYKDHFKNSWIRSKTLLSLKKTISTPTLLREKTEELLIKAI